MYFVATDKRIVNILRNDVYSRLKIFMTGYQIRHSGFEYRKMKKFLGKVLLGFASSEAVEVTTKIIFSSVVS